MLHVLVFYLVFISFSYFLVSIGVLEQPRTKHDERTKDGIDMESARGRTWPFRRAKKVIFPKCSKSNSNTRNGSASIIQIKRAQDRQMPSSYEDLSVVLPERTYKKTTFRTTARVV